MNNSKSSFDLFLSSLERGIGKTQRRKGRSDLSDVEEVLHNHQDQANQMGPVLGLLSYIYKIPLPVQFSDHSKQFTNVAGSELVIDESIYDNDKHEDEKMEALFGFDQHMEKLIMLLAERNQSFLEKTLVALDARLKGTKVSKLLQKQTEYLTSLKNLATQQQSDESKDALQKAFGKTEKQIEEVGFTLSRDVIQHMVNVKAYKAVAAIVSRNYFFCADDCGFVGSEQLDLANFLEIIREIPLFFQVATKVIESYKGHNTLKEILSCTRWTKDLRTVVALIYIQHQPDLVTLKDFVTSVQFDLLPLAMKIFKLHLEIEKEDEHLVSKVLVNSLRRAGHLQEKLYLLKMNFTTLTYESVKEFINLKVNFSVSLNPIKEVAHYYEILKMIEMSFSALKIKTLERMEQVKETITSFGNLDQNMMKAFVLDRDLQGRTTIQLVNQLHLVDFFTKLEPIIDELWRSKYERRGNMFQTSTAFQICCKTSLNNPRPLNPVTWNPLKRTHNHGFRFRLWRESPSIRFFVESVYVVLLTLAMQVCLSEIQAFVQELQNDQLASLASATDTATIQTLHKEIAETITVIISWFSYLQYPFIFFASFILLPIYDFCAQYPLKKPFKWNKIIYILDFVALAMFSFFFSQVYQLVLKNQQDDATPQFHQAITELFMEVYIANLDEFDVLLGLGIMAMWLRVVFIFRASEFIGPFIKVIGKMTTDILIFFVLYIVIIISFASVGNLAFGEFSQYSNLFQACITLFGSSLGGFDFTIIDTVVGKIYLALFLILSLIMLLNLLIAILSTTYSYYESRGRGLYLQEILGLWEDVQYGGNRGFLVIKTAPFHGATLPLIPLYICCTPKIQKRCDYLTQIFLFIPSMILHIILQLIITAICLPFAYLKLIFHSAAAISRFRGRMRLRMIARFFMVFVCGAVVLAVRMVFDLFFLVADDFRVNPPRQQIEFKGVRLHVEVLSVMTNILESKINHKQAFESVATRDVLIELRTQLGISLSYNDICHMTYDFLNIRPPTEMLMLSKDNNSPKLEQFSLAKEYLLQNSYQSGNQNYRLYPYIMIKVLEEHIQSYKQSKRSLARTDSIRRVNHGKNHGRVTPFKDLKKKANHWGSASSTQNIGELRSLDQIRSLSQSNVVKKNEPNIDRSVSGIEESEQYDQCRLPMHIQLPPLAVGHFAKVEEDQVETGGETGNEVSDPMEERISRIEKILHRSHYEE